MEREIKEILNEEGFFSVIYTDGKQLTVCTKEDGKIDLNDMGEREGICGNTNEWWFDEYDETLENSSSSDEEKIREFASVIKEAADLDGTICFKENN